jgi:cytoskeletal protein RodZ
MFAEKTPNEYAQELKTKRESLGLSLEDIFQKTRIRSSYLQAIEEGNFKALPDPIYTKNFIKIYARFLGVPEEPLIKNYEDYVNASKAMESVLQQEISDKNSTDEKLAKNKMYGGWILAALVVIFVVWMILQLIAPARNGLFFEHLSPSQKEIHSAAVPSSNTGVSTGSQKKNIGMQELFSDKMRKSPGSENTATVLLPGNPQNLSIDNQASDLVITAREKTWIRVQTAGEETPTETLLKPGEIFNKRGTAFKLDIGNAGGIQIKFRGREIGVPGKRGEVVHLQLPQQETN